MLSVVIADDERIQYEGLANYILWHKYGMKVSACAENGVEALKLIEQYKPDVLITDVKMPKMNGLELSQKAREILPDIKIIIISGFEEFEFARAAIDINSYAYILKPVDMDEMEHILQKVGSDCVAESVAREEYQRMQLQLEESRPLLMDKFKKDMICGFVNAERLIKDRAKYLALPLPESDYHVVILQDDDGFAPDMSEEKKQAFYLGLMYHVEELCKSFSESFVFQYKDNEIVLVIPIDSDNEGSVFSILVSIRENLGKHYNHTFTLGVSYKKDTLVRMQEAYKEAEIAIRQKFYLGKGKIIFYGDINIHSISVTSTEDLYLNLIAGIEAGNVQRSKDISNEIFNAFAKSAIGDEHYIKAFCYRIVGDIYRLLYSANEQAEKIFGQEYLLWNKLTSFDTIPDVRQWLLNVISGVAEHFFNKRTCKNANAVDAIIQILEKNYCEHITIDDLAKKVYLTPNYLCNIFKDNTGESIIDYLTKIRIKKAKILLNDSSMKIYEVAEKTGFGNTSYFGAVFKSICGMTASEYRDSISGKNDEK